MSHLVINSKSNAIHLYSYPITFFPPYGIKALSCASVGAKPTKYIDANGNEIKKSIFKDGKIIINPAWAEADKKAKNIDANEYKAAAQGTDAYAVPNVNVI